MGTPLVNQSAVVNYSYPKLAGVRVTLLTMYKSEGAVSYRVEYYDRLSESFQQDILTDFNLTFNK